MTCSESSSNLVHEKDQGLMSLGDSVAIRQMLSTQVDYKGVTCFFIGTASSLPFFSIQQGAKEDSIIIPDSAQFRTKLERDTALKERTQFIPEGDRWPFADSALHQSKSATFCCEISQIPTASVLWKRRLRQVYDL
jgi:hypothetical protein